MTTSDIRATQAPARPANDARRRELLRRYLNGRLPVGAATTSVRPVSRDHPLRLSFPQQRLWFLDQLQPGGTEYVAPWTWRVSGPLDAEALHAAWSAVVRRHEVLRTRYGEVDGEPVQVVDDDVRVELPCTDLSGLPQQDQERRVVELTGELVGTPFDLRRDAPLRLRLLRLADDAHVLLFAVHHIAFDGWSVGVLARELSALYTGFVAGTPAELPPLPAQYADFSAWQREQADGDSTAGQLRYWREQLAELVPVRLPTDRPRPATQDTSGASVSFTVPAWLGRAARELGRAHRATPFMVLLATFQLLLGRYSGQTDVVVGTPIAGRVRPEVRDLLGFFVSTLVLRADLSGDPSFLDLLARVRTTALAAYAHQDLPFERLVNELAPKRDLSRNPLFSHMFVLQDNESADFGGAGVHAASVPMPPHSAKFDLTLQLTERPDGAFDGVLEYATALFDEDTVVRLGAHFVELLTGVTAAPRSPISRPALVPADERRQLVAGCNDTARDVPDATVVELFERQARRTPDAVAVTSAGESFDYTELAARTNRLAHHLRALGVGPGVLVGVHLDRGIDLVVAFLAVLTAGGAYLPVDPGYPRQRIEYMLDDADARVLVTEEAFAEQVPASGLTTVLLERDRAAIAVRPSDAVGRVATPDDLAYLIYTSGSTGSPKGVLIHHRALTNFVLAMVARPGLRPGDTVVGLTTVSFDPSVLELYVPLVVGGRVALAGTDEARDPQRMVDLVDRVAPATVQATPTTWRMLLDGGWSPPADLTVLSGGEPLPDELVTRLAAHGASVWDLYGPTETTVWASTSRLGRTGGVVDWAPAANYTVHVLDAVLAPVPVGVTGELYLGGAGVARGYHRRPALTAERFVPDPYDTRPGGRLYRTGDLALRRRDGSVRILGRADHQLKIHGHRMEPGEIEAALLAHDGIRAAVVHPTATASGDPSLTAYVVPHGAAAPSATELRTSLLRVLPDYMVPTAYVVLDALPRTPTGKVDRAALPAPAEHQKEEREHVAPRTAAERTVARVWHDVLDRPAIGVHDDFFELGGHSLLATRVAIRLRAALGIDVPVRALFDHATVATLAAALPDYPRAPVEGTGPTLAPRRRARHPGRPEERTAPRPQEVSRDRR
jgi:amino acid adenylation domain-containing protein